MLSRLERRFGRFALPQVTLGLIVCQVLMYGAAMAKPEVVENAQLIRQKVLDGEVWRLLTFLAIPPLSHPIFALFFWYLFYLMGSALEHFWGTFRYNVYLLIGYFATVAVTMLTPLPAGVESFGGGNAFLQGSVFLAFAYLCPNFELCLFFILPVKIKWFALATWIGIVVTLLVGDWLMRLTVLTGICNFVLFFGKDIAWHARMGRRRMAAQAARFGHRDRRDEPFHRCVVCGITDKSHPQMDFRYCTQCEGSCGYCIDHIRNHEHVKAAEPAAEA